MESPVSTHERPVPTDTTRPFWHRILPPAHRGLWSAGILLALLAAGAIAANLRLPVLVFMVPGGEALSGWDDLRDPGGLAYEQRLLTWPLVSCSLTAVVGILVAARAYVPPVHGWWVRPLRAPVLWLLAFSGFLLTLTGTRWLGFFLARRSETDQVLVRLGVVPYLNLALGVLVIVGAAWGLARLLRDDPGPRWAAWSAVAAAGGLLLSPLLPFAHWSFGGGGVVRLDEFTLAALAGGASAAPEALGWARMALWAALYASLVACLAWSVGPAPRVMAWLRRLVALDALFVTAGVVSLVRFYRRLPDLRPGVAVDLNPFLPLALLALTALWWVQVRPLFVSRRSPAA